MYDEADYLLAVQALDDAVRALLRNEISTKEIVELTMNAIVNRAEA